MALNNDTIGTLKTNIDALYESSLTEEVIRRLDSFGVEVTEEDTYLIAFSIRKVEEFIKNECNIDSVPDGFTCHAVDMTCGEFMNSKYSVGKLDISTIDLDGVIASVNVGGASVSYDNTASDSTKFSGLVQKLMSGGDLTCYRRLKW